MSCYWFRPCYNGNLNIIIIIIIIIIGQIKHNCKKSEPQKNFYLVANAGRNFESNTIQIGTRQSGAC